MYDNVALSFFIVLIWKCFELAGKTLEIVPVRVQHRVIRYLADLDSLTFPKGNESESLVQAGGLRCDQGFRYGRILMETV